MKTKKQPKQIRYIVVVRDHDVGPRSVHNFRDEYSARELYEKLKFALEIIKDDWYYVTMEEVSE